MVTAIVTIIIFLVMISLHEFGHFIVSKLSGVKVLEFAIGMGPAILKWRGKETLYSLRILPIGGYCKLEGEDEKTDDERAFCNQKWWKRFLVIIAGAVLNIILGFVILFSLTGREAKIPTPYVYSLTEAGYMDDAGIIPGDKITEINGNKIRFYGDISLYTSNMTDGEEISVTVKRDGKKIKTKLKASREETVVYYEENGARVISSINNQPATEEIYEYTDKDAAAEYIGTSQNSKRYILGFVPKQEEVGFLNNLEYSYHYTGFVVRLVYQGLWDMISGKTGLEQVSGPVGIVTAVNTAVNSGAGWITDVLFLAALLTINLGIFNLLPIPALDGGRLFFMIIELVRDKPIPAEKEGMVHAIGLMLLLAFAVIVSFKDILMLLK